MNKHITEDNISKPSDNFSDTMMGMFKEFKEMIAQVVIKAHTKKYESTRKILQSEITRLKNMVHVLKYTTGVPNNRIIAAEQKIKEIQDEREDIVRPA